MKVLNVTNGDYFNEYFLKNSQEYAVPFREAMMDGVTCKNIFSKEFIKLRSRDVKEAEYVFKMEVCEYLKDESISELHLWFGKDTFCQMNLLTLLAYLEQIGFNGKVLLNYIDDENFSVIDEKISVTLGIYEKTYEEVLILKQKPCDIGVLYAEAIELYFDYLSSEGALARTVKENQHMRKNKLIGLILEKSRKYGFSDLQAEKLIDKYVK